MGSYTVSGFRLAQIARTGVQQFSALRRLRQEYRDGLGAQPLRSWLQSFDSSIRERCDIDLRRGGLRTLDVGHGQNKWFVAYVAALGNDATGIDLDVTPDGLSDLRGHLRLWRLNGTVRLAKSIARSLTGVDSEARSAFCREMKIDRWPRFRTLYMDATKMEFAADTFDFIHSFDVFEHIERPGDAVREIVRVLRPGGKLWLRFVHYAWYNAPHDMRTVVNAPDSPPHWAHLVPSARELVQPGAYINSLRIADWQALFAEHCPGSVVHLEPQEDPRLRERLVAQLAEWRQQQQLADYGDEELLTDCLTVTWQKPSAR